MGFFTEDVPSMISREEAIELLTDYYESTLSPELRAAVEERLARCRTTAHVLETYKKTVVLYRTVLRDRSTSGERRARLLILLRERVRG